MFSMFSSNTKEFEGKNFYSYSARNSNGEEIDMSTYIGKVALIVNIASQYEEVEPSALNFPTSGLADENFKQLAELDKRYRDQGLVIIGFPTNQFAGQEPAIQEEILSFVHRKYNVDFEIYQKIDVNGPNTHPLFHYLKNVLPGTITNDLKWHFTKFLIDRNGNPVKRYAPNDSPLSFEEEIRHLLRQQSVLVKGMQNLPQGEGAQQGLQPMVGIQKNLQEQQGSTPVWEKERLEKEKPQSSNVGPSGGVGLQAQSLKHEKDLQGKGKLEEKNLEMGGGQGLQYQKSERDAGGKKEEKNLEIGGGKGLQYQKSEKDDWGNKKEEKNLEIGGGKGVQYQKSGKDEWGNREETNLNIGGQGAQGIQYETKPHSTGEGMTLQEQIDLQNQRERELQRDRMLATGQSYAHAAKEKIVDTAQAVKQKVSDTALAVKEGLQNITGIGQTQEAGQPREILRPQKSRPMTLQEIIDQQLQRERDVENDRRLAQQQAASKGVQQKGFMSQQQPLQQQQQFGESSQKQQQQQPGFVSQQQQQQPGQGYMQTDLSEEQRAKGFQDQSGLTGEGGTVGAQMGVHLGAHSIQAGVQAGKDPSKTREQSK